MKPHQMLEAALTAALLSTAASAQTTPATGEAARLATNYASWAGGRSNAEMLVNGLSSGSSITLATKGPDRAVSIAGFTPARPMSYQDVNAALARAQRELSRVGISRPTAEEIQAALIGGEVTLPDGATMQMAGLVPASGAPTGPLASR